MTHALTSALEAAPGGAGPSTVLDDFIGPVSATSAADLPVTAADGIPGLDRISYRG
jgi:hypothetical protein